MDSLSSDSEAEMNVPLARLVAHNSSSYVPPSGEMSATPGDQSRASTSSVYSPGCPTDLEEELVTSGSEYSPECEVEKCGRKHKNLRNITQKEAKDKETINDLLEEIINTIVGNEQIENVNESVSKTLPEDSEETVGFIYGREVPNDATETGRSRKRQRKPETWKKNIQKRLKYSGQEYVGHRGIVYGAKEVKQSCNEKCKLKCSKKFDEATRTNIFQHYWGLEDKVQQRHFINRHVEQCPVKRATIGAKKSRTSTVKYFLYSKEEKTQVCRVFFSKHPGHKKGHSVLDG